MAIDLSKLIDEVLRMAKTSMSQRSFSETADRMDKSSEAYNKRWHEKEMVASGHEFGLKKQTLTNTGQLDVAKEQSSGALARQRLVGSSAENVANIGLTGTKYSSDQSLTGTKYSSDQSLVGTKYTQDRMLETEKYKIDDPDKLIGEWIKAGFVTDPTTILEMRRRLRVQNAAKVPSLDDITSFSKSQKLLSEPSSLTQRSFSGSSVPMDVRPKSATGGDLLSVIPYSSGVDFSARRDSGDIFERRLIQQKKDAYEASRPMFRNPWGR